MKNAKIRKIYGICFLVCTALLAAAFVTQALRLHFSGGYSMERVKEKLAQLLLPSLLWMMFLLAGVVVYELFPVERKKPRAAANPRMQIKRLAAKLPEGVWKPSEKLLQNKLIALWAIVGALCGVAFFFPLCYLLNPSHFNYGTTNEEMLQVTIHTLPFVGIAFAVVAAAMLAQSCFLRKALEEVKQLTVAAAKAGNLKKESVEDFKAGWLDNLKVLWIVRGVILVCAIFLMAFGIANGGFEWVWAKGAKLCMECVGLA